MVALDAALRLLGLPGLGLWDTVLGRPSRLVVHEDNQAMMRVCQTGRNPTMRYLKRTHRTSVAWLHEVCSSDAVELCYTESALMAADIYTKAFTDSQKWEGACWNIGVCPPASLVDMASLGDSPPPQTGGDLPKSAKTQGYEKRDEDDNIVWVQHRYGARKFQALTKNEGAPTHSQVWRRRTFDIDSGVLIATHDKCVGEKNFPGSWWGLIPNGPRNVETRFYYDVGRTGAQGVGSEAGCGSPVRAGPNCGPAATLGGVSSRSRKRILKHIRRTPMNVKIHHGGPTVYSVGNDDPLFRSSLRSIVS